MDSKAISHYMKILDRKKQPKFKKLELYKKIRSAKKILKKCTLCEHNCKVNRAKQKGICGCPDKPWISSFFEHYGEERFLVPSFTVFFMGCNLSCEFCQNWTISQRKERGMYLTAEELATIIDEHAHCKNVNFVGGDPTPYMPFILETLKYVKANIPIIWNSNFYMTEESMELLEGAVDIYLSDFKYGNNKCGKRLSNVGKYFDIVSRNHLLAFKDSELVIRHLVLPNHFECCTKKIFDFIAENFKDNVIVNIMDQYRPEYKANSHKDIDRRLTHAEFKAVVEYAEKLGLNFVI